MGVYKTPRWQTVDDIKKITQGDSAYYDAFYYLKSLSDFKYFTQNHLLSFPGVYIFDKNLSPIKALDATDCGWQAMQFISTLTDSTKVQEDDRIKFKAQQLLKHSAILAGDSGLIKNRDFDYLYIYTWVSYLPKFTKAQFVYSNKIKENKNVNIKVISLNEDFMTEWNKDGAGSEGKKVKNIAAPNTKSN